MKAKFLLAAVIFGNTLSFNSVFAAELALGPCMVSAMTGKERKEIAQWFFFTIAAHPEIKEYSKVSETIKNKTDERVANLLTRLLTEDCLAQAKAANAQEGQAALAGAFRLVGEVAIQELQIDKDVLNSATAFTKYLDKDKFKKISSEN